MATVQPLKSSIDRQPEQLMLIDGERVRAVSGNTINVFDPSTGPLIGTVPDGAQADKRPRRRLVILSDAGLCYVFSKSSEGHHDPCEFIDLRRPVGFSFRRFT